MGNTKTSSLSNVKAIAASGDFSFIIKEDEKFEIWGDYDYETNRRIWGLNNIKEVAIGAYYKRNSYNNKLDSVEYHTVILKEDGVVITLGNNTYGQCYLPGQITNVTEVQQRFALLEDGRVVTLWGELPLYLPKEGITNVKAITGNFALKDNGSLALLQHILGSKIVNSIDGVANVKAIASDYCNVVLLKEDGTVSVMGDDTYGQCNVPEGLINVKTVSVCNFTISALKEDGTVVVWGNNDYGKCDVPEGLDNVKSIATGLGFIAALKEDGTVVVWGNNKYGQCNVPEGLTDVKAIAAGFDFILALKEDGTVVAWGDNYYGQCDVPEGLVNVKEIVAGDYTAALKEDGTLVIWGVHYFSRQNKIPENLTNVKAVSIYDNYLSVLKNDGTIIGFRPDSYYSQGNFLLPSYISSVSASHNEVIGDFNGDKKVNSTDYAMLKRYLLEIIRELPVKDKMYVGDLNRDNKINSIDYVLLNRYILEKIDRLPYVQ